MKTCFPSITDAEIDLMCLECLFMDHIEGLDERGTLEIVEVENEMD